MYIQLSAKVLYEKDDVITSNLKCTYSKHTGKYLHAVDVITSNLKCTYSYIERKIVNWIFKTDIIMESFLKEKVVDQQINGLPMEEYLASLCEQVENDKIEKIKSESIIAITKQMNNRHKNVIDAQRVMLKEQEFEIQHLQQQVAQ